MSFLFQFMRIYPTYVADKTRLEAQPDVYLFGESYGGTVVTNLAGLLLKMPSQKSVKLKGIGIGNGFIRFSNCILMAKDYP